MLQLCIEPHSGGPDLLTTCLSKMVLRAFQKVHAACMMMEFSLKESLSSKNLQVANSVPGPPRSAALRPVQVETLARVQIS